MLSIILILGFSVAWVLEIYWLAVVIACIAALRILAGFLSKVEKEQQEKELNERGLQTMKVSRRIHHHYKGVFGPYDTDEIREEEIIVPQKKRK